VANPVVTRCSLFRRFADHLPRLASSHVLVGVFALISDETGRALVVKSRYWGEWTLPGGTVRRGERPLDALHRECREELGAPPVAASLLGVWPGTYGLAQCAVYGCELGRDPPLLSDEHSAFRFVKVEELPLLARELLTSAIAIA
jgi:8-oxo-dGTP diphosphatase